MAPVKQLHPSEINMRMGNVKITDAPTPENGESLIGQINLDESLNPGCTVETSNELLKEQINADQSHIQESKVTLSDKSFTRQISNLETNLNSDVSFIRPTLLENPSLKLLQLESSISVLSLSNMKLSQLPDDFARFINLSEVDFSINELKYLPKSFLALTKLRILNLSKNIFVEPPLCLYSGLYLVKDLNLSYNQLDYFNVPPLCLPFLTILKLNNNSLKSPPLWLYRDIPSSVEYLDLSNNPSLTIEFDRDFITPASNLVANKITKVLLTNCGLNESNTIFMNYFNNLKSLDIGNATKNFVRKFKDISLNSFQDLPMKNVSSIKTIEEIHVRNAFMSGIVKDISSFVNLKVLDIVCNDINWLPSSVCLLKNLKVLKASECGLYFLPEEFGSLTSLQELYLNNNGLPSLPESFKNLDELEVLDLYDNNLSEMPDLSGLKKLKALDLWLNNIDPPSEILVNECTLQYNTLRETLNGYIECCKNRMISKRELIQDSNDSGSRDGDYVKDYSSSTSSIDKDPEIEGFVERISSTEDENWDSDMIGDDNFDPNVAGRLSGQFSSSNESLTRIPHHMKDKSHFFCPYKKQLQFWGTQREFSNFVDGQFDDS